MKPFLDIGKSQQEIILAIILACSPLGMLLQFGLGLSDATQQESSIGQQPRVKNRLATLNTVKSGITDTQ